MLLRTTPGWSEGLKLVIMVKRAIAMTFKWHRLKVTESVSACTCELAAEIIVACM